ncbi:DUF4249 domain-containing protein [Ekhidna sp.]|uniref:DUF4249 domain-containing protein n=1 Tax=Ekhidna sp. TaxID=2608089 RepID=UPI003C79FAFF
MKHLIYLLIIAFLACEEVVDVDLPDPQNQVVVEGWVTDSTSAQPIRITRSNAFSSLVPFIPVDDAQVIVQSRDGDVFSYSYTDNGYYEANTAYRGTSGTQYRVRIILDSIEVRSEWDAMPEQVPIDELEIASFQENDPDNSDQQITIYYPKINTLDPGGQQNFYRWIFYKNGELFTEPEPISVQDDRLFDGNLIPNNFQEFDYESGDEMTVQLVSISQRAHGYLSLLRSQITTLGTSSGTTPAIVSGNLFFVDGESEQVLGFFGAVSGSYASETVP